MMPRIEAAPTGRIGAVDFWRGLVLIAIFCDHIPGNVWEKATPRNFAFSDSAEAFVFLSGVSVALAYYKKAQRLEWRSLIVRCLSRALRIYGVHLLLTVLGVFVFAIAYALSREPRLLVGHGREYVFQQPAATAFGVVTLSEQLGYFNILPMYVLFMLWAPAALALARLNAILLLALSFAVYLAARYFGWTLSSWPEPGVWFFNPLTWQFIFTIGVVCGIVLPGRALPYSAFFYWACWLFLAVSAIVVTDGFGAAPGLRDIWFAKLDLEKSQLGAVRLFHFAALSYALAQTSFTWLENTGLGQALERLGRHSLPVFGYGSVLAYAGQAAMKLVSINHAGFASAAGLIYTLLGLVSMFLFARWLEGPALWDSSSSNEGEGASSPEFSRAPRSVSPRVSPRARQR